MEEGKEYYSINVCVKCEKELDDESIMYGNGTCKHCGHTVEGTICAYKKKVLTRHIKAHEFRGTKKASSICFSKNWFNRK